jgi:hypothetical protein
LDKPKKGIIALFYMLNSWTKNIVQNTAALLVLVLQISIVMALVLTPVLRIPEYLSYALNNEQERF